MSQKVRVFICHFNKQYRKHLKWLLQHADNAIDVVGECKEFPDCVEFLENNKVDQVIISIPSFIVNRVRILETLREWFPHVEFTEFSIHEIDRIVNLYETSNS